MGRLYARYRYFAAKALCLVVVVVLLIGFSGWAEQANAHDAAVADQIAEAERAASRGPYATDGTFEGSAQGYGGMVKMQVVIKNGHIDSVVIADASSEDDAWLKMCLNLPDQIVAAQTTALDTVSGATFTSAAILNGTTEALQKSMAGDVA